MIERVFLKRIFIDRFIENLIFDVNRNKHVLIKDRLTDKDQKILNKMCTIFKSFYN